MGTRPEEPGARDPFLSMHAVNVYVRDRRAAHELEIARRVQARLFPQRLPELQSLEYAGACVQTHQVGGDYYDFLDLGQARLCLVLGDIAGKGIAAALLMANLQANLRSQCANAEQPEQLLQSVNRLFYENTADNAYATLFYSEFDDRTCRLRYAKTAVIFQVSSCNEMER
jgi:phosphoserine phosphatase RsbU/P